MWVFVCMCVYVSCAVSAFGGQKRALDSLELELQIVVGIMWELGTNLNPVEEQPLSPVRH